MISTNETIINTKKYERKRKKYSRLFKKKNTPFFSLIREKVIMKKYLRGFFFFVKSWGGGHLELRQITI